MHEPQKYRRNLMRFSQLVNLGLCILQPVNYSPLHLLTTLGLSSQSFFILWVVTVFLGITVGLLWLRREKQLLKRLQQMISEENPEENEAVKHNYDDIEAALKALFDTRKEELQQLQRLENYRRDYIGNVAHELKTPIFSIQGYIETVLDDPDLDRNTLESFLGKANKNADRLGQIVMDLDTITKYESGFLVLDQQPFDLLALVNEVVESLELQAKEKHITLQVFAPAGEYQVMGDRGRLSQVLTNLGYNSIRYGNESGNTRFRLSSTGTKVIVEVADNGIGIPQEHLGRVFERFFRVDKHRNRATGGSGLGLSICKHVVEAHGETISVISTEGAGSVFSFSVKSAVEA
jgi:two-component system, OmpR family, phosphate regulon sensor histidine kinase PhoR